MSVLLCRLCPSQFVSLKAWEAHMLAHHRLAKAGGFGYWEQGPAKPGEPRDPVGEFYRDDIGPVSTKEEA